MYRRAFVILLISAGFLAGCGSTVQSLQPATAIQSPQRSQFFNDDWLFLDADTTGGGAVDYDASAWHPVDLAARREPPRSRKAVAGRQSGIPSQRSPTRYCESFH